MIEQIGTQHHTDLGLTPTANSLRTDPSAIDHHRFVSSMRFGEDKSCFSSSLDIIKGFFRSIVNGIKSFLYSFFCCGSCSYKTAEAIAQTPESLKVQAKHLEDLRVTFIHKRDSGEYNMASDKGRMSFTTWWGMQFNDLPESVQKDIIIDEMKRWARAKLEGYERPTEQRIEEYALGLYQEPTQVLRAKRYLVELTPQETRSKRYDPIEDAEVPARLDAVCNAYRAAAKQADTSPEA